MSSPISSSGVWFKMHMLPYYLVILLLSCDTSIGQDKDDIEKQDWLKPCCGNKTLQNKNRTLVTLGYLTAVTKLKGRWVFWHWDKKIFFLTIWTWFFTDLVEKTQNILEVIIALYVS